MKWDKFSLHCLAIGKDTDNIAHGEYQSNAVSLCDSLYNKYE